MGWYVIDEFEDDVFTISNCTGGLPSKGVDENLRHICRVYKRNGEDGKRVELILIEIRTYNTKTKMNIYEEYETDWVSFCDTKNNTEDEKRELVVTKGIITVPVKERAFNNDLKQRGNGYLDIEKKRFIWTEYENDKKEEYTHKIIKVRKTDTYKGYPVYDI